MELDTYYDEMLRKSWGEDFDPADHNYMEMLELLENCDPDFHYSGNFFDEMDNARLDYIEDGIALPYIEADGKFLFNNIANVDDGWKADYFLVQANIDGLNAVGLVKYSDYRKNPAAWIVYDKREFKAVKALEEWKAAQDKAMEG